MQGVDLSAVALDVRALRVAPLQEQLRSAAQQVAVQAAVAGPDAGAPCFADPPSPQGAAQEPSASLPGDSEAVDPEPSTAPAAAESQASGLSAGPAADTAAPAGCEPAAPSGPQLGVASDGTIQAPSGSCAQALPASRQAAPVQMAGDAAQAPLVSSTQTLAQGPPPASMQAPPAQPGLWAADAAQATAGGSIQDPTQQPASEQELPASAGDAPQAAPCSSLQDPANRQKQPAQKRDRRVPAARRKRPDLQANGFIAQERKAAMVEEVQAASEAVRQQWETGMAGAAKVCVVMCYCCTSACKSRLPAGSGGAVRMPHSRELPGLGRLLRSGGGRQLCRLP